MTVEDLSDERRSREETGFSVGVRAAWIEGEGRVDWEGRKGFEEEDGDVSVIELHSDRFDRRGRGEEMVEESMSFDLERVEDPLKSFDSDCCFAVVHPSDTPSPSLHPGDLLEPPHILLEFLIPCEHPPSLLLPLVNLELVWEFEKADMLQTRKRSR